MPLSDAEYKKRYGQTRKQAEAARKKTRASAAYKKKRAELDAKKKPKKSSLKASDMPKGWARKKAAPKPKTEDKPKSGTRVKDSDGRFSYPGTKRDNPKRKTPRGGGSGSTGTGGGRARYG